jgi:hypothetical protein
MLSRAHAVLREQQAFDVLPHWRHLLRRPLLSA